MPEYKRRKKRTQSNDDTNQRAAELTTASADTSSFSQGDNTSSQKFNDLFHSERGDLFFGLGNVINGYRTWWGMISYRQDYMAIVFGPQQATTVATDILKNENIPILFDGSQPQKEKIVKAIKDNFHQSILNGGPPQPWWLFIRFPESGKNGPLREKFVSHLNKEGYRYSIEKIIEESFQELLSHVNDTDSAVDDTLERQWILNTGKKVITRGSKAALDMILESKGEEKIHFILDDIDMDKVINKRESGGDYSERSTTAAELRFLYRHKDKIENKVIFYLNGLRVSAPWLTEPVRWSRYKPKRS